MLGADGLYVVVHCLLALRRRSLRTDLVAAERLDRWQLMPGLMVLSAYVVRLYVQVGAGGLVLVANLMDLFG